MLDVGGLLCQCHAYMLVLFSLFLFVDNNHFRVSPGLPVIRYNGISSGPLICGHPRHRPPLL